MDPKKPALFSVRGILLFIWLCFIFLPLRAQTGHYQAYAAAAVKMLQQWYDPGTGQYRSTGWWNTANAITALTDYTRLTGDSLYLGVIRHTFETCRSFDIETAQGGKRTIRNFINDYYDDEGWWALAWIDFYDLTRESKYLRMAEVIFRDMVKGWSDACGGGIYWKKPDHGKNAIENELFLLTAIRLHNRCADTSLVAGRSFLQWAVSDWNWFRQVRLVNQDFLVEDGLDRNCQAVHHDNYTYNQGVILSGLTELGEALKDTLLTGLAVKIATAAIHTLVYPDGILREPTEPHCNQDAIQFKGIFMRHLGALYRKTGNPAFRAFILKNADHLWLYARDPRSGEIGSLWEGPFDRGDAGRQSAALDALNAALAVMLKP